MNVDSSSPASRGRGRKLWSGTRPVIAYGMPPLGWRDLYHRALTVSWPVFFLSLAVLFLLLNGAFATLYLLGHAPIANQSPAGFGGAFFFSVETLATVGYGDMHPQTVYAHLVATFEIFVGMSGIAMATGTVFARFSRPQAKILFARYAIVRPLNGRMTLMVRAANARQNVIAEAQAKLRLMRVEGTHEGYTLRKIHDLALVRSEHPIFLLGWNLMHVIDESSALFGETPESLAARDASLLITIEGSDETTAQVMQARHSWEHDEIRWRHRYVDLMHDEDGITHIDYTHFHEVVPVDADTDERGSPGAVVNAGAATSARPRRRARGAVDSAAPARHAYMSRMQQARCFALFDRDRAAECVAILGARDVVAEHAFVRQQMRVEGDLQRAGEQQVGRGEAVADEPWTMGECLRECALHAGDVAPAERDRIARRAGEFSAIAGSRQVGVKNIHWRKRPRSGSSGATRAGAGAAVGKIEQHRARFGERRAAVVERGQLGHRVDLHESVAALFVRTQVDRHEFIHHAEFFEHPQGPECPGLRPVVELHRASALGCSCRSGGCSSVPSSGGSDRGAW